MALLWLWFVCVCSRAFFIHILLNLLPDPSPCPLHIWYPRIFYLLQPHTSQTLSPVITWILRGYIEQIPRNCCLPNGRHYSYHRGLIITLKFKGMYIDRWSFSSIFIRLASKLPTRLIIARSSELGTLITCLSALLAIPMMIRTLRDAYTHYS